MEAIGDRDGDDRKEEEGQPFNGCNVWQAVGEEQKAKSKFVLFEFLRKSLPQE
jgi:hypothetical protein